MVFLDIFCHPLWAALSALLAFVVRLQRRANWDPRACTVRLTGKTAIVTGANTGWFTSYQYAGLTITLGLLITVDCIDISTTACFKLFYGVIIFFMNAAHMK